MKYLHPYNNILAIVLSKQKESLFKGLCIITTFLNSHKSQNFKALKED